jgi:hypothetical protein
MNLVKCSSTAGSITEASSSPTEGLGKNLVGFLEKYLPPLVSNVPLSTGYKWSVLNFTSYSGATFPKEIPFSPGVHSACCLHCRGFLKLKGRLTAPTNSEFPPAYCKA